MNVFRNALVTFILLFAACLSSHAVPVPAQRAVWVWEEDAFRLLENKSFQKEITTFLEQRHISTVYLYADEFRGRNILANEPKKYREFIKDAHKRGFKVYALVGSYYLKTPEYIFPEKRGAAMRMFGNVLSFNSAGDSSSQFDGINVDIEPYLLDDWDSQKPLRIQQYLQLSAQWMRMKTDAQSTIAVGPAMPFWFDGIEDVEWNGKRQKLNEHLQDIYDYVAIMDYRNFAAGSDGIISHALDELQYADRAKRKVVIGVETLASTPEKVTFFGKGSAYMENELSLAEAAFLQHPSFAGFVIHHLSSYQRLAASREENIDGR